MDIISEFYYQAVLVSVPIGKLQEQNFCPTENRTKIPRLDIVVPYKIIFINNYIYICVIVKVKKCNTGTSEKLCYRNE
jgi:hypothetical protein